MQGRDQFSAIAQRRVFDVVAATAAMLWMTGCSHAPEFNILGSYFPAWLLCIAAGIVLTWVIYMALQRAHLEREVQPSIVVYPCMAALLSFILWLLLFSR